MLAQMGKMYSKWPHELAFGANDVPGSDIEMSAVVFDIQATIAYGEERAAAAKAAQQRRRR